MLNNPVAVGKQAQVVWFHIPVDPGKPVVKPDWRLVDALVPFSKIFLSFRHSKPSQLRVAAVLESCVECVISRRIPSPPDILEQKMMMSLYSR